MPMILPLATVQRRKQDKKPSSKRTKKNATRTSAQNTQNRLRKKLLVTPNMLTCAPAKCRDAARCKM
jgi:hypothetical protein